MTGHAPGTVVELGHIVLYVGDLDTSRAFYGDDGQPNETPRIANKDREP